MNGGTVPSEELPMPRPNDNEIPYELTSVERFAEWLVDEERDQFTAAELHELAYQLKGSWRQIKTELEAYGFTVAGVTDKGGRIRTFRDSSNDRWFGPGSSPSHGGSGWEQIAGFAGQEG